MRRFSLVMAVWIVLGLLFLVNGSDAHAFGNDVLVADLVNDIEGHPDMVCTASGKCYLVAESMDNNCINIFLSTNGGGTWIKYFSTCGPAGYDIKNPAIAVPKLAEDYLYVVFTYGDNSNSLWLLRIDLTTKQYTFHSVEHNPGGIANPRIVTDNLLRSYYSLYVTYVSAETARPYYGEPVVRIATSGNKGANWTSQRLFNCPPDFCFGTTFNCKPDIAYGGGTNLYVVFTLSRQEVPDCGEVFLVRSTNLATNWDPVVRLDYDFSVRARVAAAEAGQKVVVVYDDDWSDGVKYNFSTDGGRTWSGPRFLLDSDSIAEVDIAANTSSGSFYVAYNKGDKILFTQTKQSFPTGSPSSDWTEPRIVNDTGEASGPYAPPSVAVHWPSLQPGVAWSDYRSSTHAIYFDRSDWPDGRAEIIGTWDSGIWYRNVATSSWTKMISALTIGDVAAGDFTGDGKADVASIWLSGLWFQNGATLGWTKVTSTAPYTVTAGDITGDGRAEIIGTWDSGIWYRDVAASTWTKMWSNVPSGDIAAGDFTGDGKADVASIWSSGLWYQNGATLSWTNLANTAPYRVTAGDVTGDGRAEIIRTWDSGISYINVAKKWTWTKMSKYTTKGDIAAGDFTGDGKADVASCWDSGLWYQDGDSLGWTKVTSTAPYTVTAGDITGN